jgi:hypothetical protein
MLKRTIAARVEADQLLTTPNRIREMLCPDLSAQAVASLKHRVADTVIHGCGTGSSAAVRAREMQAKSDYVPVAYNATQEELEGLNGDPNSIGGLHKCGNCVKNCLQDWRHARTDEDRAHVVFRPNSYWKDAVGRDVAQWCHQKWGQWSIQKPLWFVGDWGQPSATNVTDYMKKKNLFFVHHVPDEYIPSQHLKLLGGPGRKKKLVTEQNGARFTVDRKNGDAICVDCGHVARENIMHEGQQYRTFSNSDENTADKNHHGLPKNPLLSDAYGTSTSLSRNNFGQIGGFGRGASGWGGAKGGGSLETALANAHSYTEMNLSAFGRTEKGATREAYKDQQKLESFREINHIGDALNLHPTVVHRAHVLFAGFRDDRERVEQWEGVLAACLWLAFDEISKEGKKILAVTAGDLAERDESMREKTLSAAATRRDTLHTAKCSGVNLDTNVSRMFVKGADGKGGVDAAEVDDRMSAVAKKPMPQWDLDDIRDFLIAAGMDIAKKQSLMVPKFREEIAQLKAAEQHADQQFRDVLRTYLESVHWTFHPSPTGDESKTFAYAPGSSPAAPGVLNLDWFDDNRKLTKFIISEERASGKTDAEIAVLLELEDKQDAAKQGAGKRLMLEKRMAECVTEDDEEALEGLLMEKAMVLCEKLEEEMEGSTSATGTTTKSTTAPSKISVSTSRVSDMGVLSIKWQGKDERGSGGAGGVGNNSRNNLGAAPLRGGRGGGKTAGQILMLKTSKKITDIVEDGVVGNLIFTALENVKNGQKEMKRKRTGNDHAQLRVNQMKRKNYLAVRQEELKKDVLI